MSLKITALLAVFPFVASIGQTATEIARVAIKSTVSIVALDGISQPLGYGSGFIIDDELVATNVHVIENCKSAYVLLNGQEKKYTVNGYVAIDKANDLVIIKVSGLFGSKLDLASENLPEIGEKIYAVGNPKGLSGTFSEGILSGIRELSGNQVLQITAPISPGSSGGPVLNSSGLVIGIAFASYASGQNLNFAIPVKYLSKLIANKISLVLLSTVKSQPKTSSAVTANIKEGVSVRNIQQECFGADGTIITFSIKNNLGYSVDAVKILFLAYDATGTVVDYFEYTYSTYDYSDKKSDGIKPFLAKTIGCSDQVVLKGKFSKVTARILDFKILEE